MQGPVENSSCHGSYSQSVSFGSDELESSSIHEGSGIVNAGLVAS